MIVYSAIVRKEGGGDVVDCLWRGGVMLRVSEWQRLPGDG